MSVKDCRHCKSEIDSKVRICPHCRKRQRVLLPVAAFSLVMVTSFLTGLIIGGWHFMPGPVSGRPTGVATQPRQTWRITSTDFQQLSTGAELERVQTTLGPPTMTWWEEKTVLVALWANPDSSNLVLGFEPNDLGRFVMATKSHVDLPATLPAE